jgi:DNA-binding transcriptional MerR regulator
VDPRIPEKQYFRIGEVAEIAEVEPYVLRFWETEFPSLKPSKTKSNRRQYSRRDVEHVLRIRDLLYEEGYTIPGARRRLKNRSSGAEIEVPARTKGLLVRIKKEAEDLLRLVEE